MSRQPVVLRAGAVNPGLAVLALSWALSAGIPPQPEGHEALYNLDYERAIRLFEAETRRQPGEASPWNHLAQALLNRALFRGEALTTDLFSKSNPFLRARKVPMPPDEVSRFLAAIEKALAVSSEQLRRDPMDREGLYTSGVAYAHRAQYHLFVRKAYFDALRDGTSSRKQHAKLRQAYPAEPDALLIPGLHSYITGSLPAWVRALAFLAGFRGDKAEGLRLLERAASEGRRTAVDARVIYALILGREAQPARALPIFVELSAAFPGNFLYRAESAILLAAVGRRTEADAAVDAMERMKQANQEEVQRMPEGFIEKLRTAVAAAGSGRMGAPAK